MPLHDWRDPERWPGVHHLWIAELFRWIQRRQPPGYEADIVYSTRLNVGGPDRTPDVTVLRTIDEPPAAGPSPDALEPDIEVAVATLEEVPLIHVHKGGWLVAVVEVISPRNKDRPDSRDATTRRLSGYLQQGVHALIIDVLPRPYGFSFADAISASHGVEQPPLPPPMAAAFRVGEPVVGGGRLLAVWRRPLPVGSAMPTVPLPLSVYESVVVDLEATYAAAVADMRRL